MTDRVTLEVFLDDSLYACCGTDLVVGGQVAWPLNFELGEKPDASQLTGVLEQPAPTSEGVPDGLCFHVGAALFYVSDESLRRGEVTLTGRALYINHGYVPLEWPLTTGTVRRIRSTGGRFHHRWTSSDSHRVWGGQDTRVTVQLEQ